MTEQVQRQVGRRERKKAQTRKALADAALRLFLERGFDQVTVTEVADAADVSVTTLFKHFPDGKEALLFDEDTDHEAALIAAVRERAPGQSILDAVRDRYLAEPALHTEHSAEFRRFLALIDSTPALRDYGHRMLLRHESALAAAIAAEVGAAADDLRAAALARFMLEAVQLADRQPDRRQALIDIVDLLKTGWGHYGTQPVRHSQTR